MPDAHEGQEALDRAIRIYRATGQFLDACFEWLSIEDHPLFITTPFFLRGLQTFEGVPEVYPFAASLLDALGPGHRYEVGWPPLGWSPGLPAALGDVAYHVRDLVVETWGWPPGLDKNILNGLVGERKQSGMPTSRRRIAEVLEEIDALPSELRRQCYMEQPPFSEPIPPEKRDQFDRLVHYQLDETLKGIGDGPQLSLRQGSEGETEETHAIHKILEAHLRELNERIKATPLYQAGEFFRSRVYMDWLRDRTYRRLDDLDAFERELSEEAGRPKPPPDPVRMAEEHEYQNAPIIGLRAAKIGWRAFGMIRDFNEELRSEIVSERRRLRRLPAAVEHATGATSFPETLAPQVPPPSKTSVVQLAPGSKALAAAYQLAKEERPVSLKAACDLAGVDRKNVRKNYPEAVVAIRALSSPDGTPRRGGMDRRSGNLEAFDEDD